jgi:RimJ/RimL family protein N-acetyltransferase
VIVTVQDPRLLAWVQAQIGTSFRPDSYTIANVTDDGAVLAAVVYTNWHRTGCEMAIASTSPRWATRGFMRACLAYPFKQLGLKRLSMVTSENNGPCQLLCLWLGAKIEGQLRRWYADGSDAIVYGLFEEDLPEWVFGEKDGKRRFPERTRSA